MGTEAVEGPAAGGGELAGLEPLKTIKRRWPTIIAGLLSVAMVVGVLQALLARGIAGLSRAVPDDPRFYISFALLYMSLPVADYVIFRRLWKLPIAGLGALIKKRIANEVVFGYSGEAYFYSWARQHATMVAAPFGAVKDVSILSAIAGNALTLAMIAIALPIGHGLLRPDEFSKLAWSTAVVIAMSLPFLIFSKRVFSLPRRTLWWIFLVHLARVIIGSVLNAVTWHFAMPSVSLGLWLLLEAGRLLISRLPFVPNNNLVFANFAILLIGQGEELANLIALTAVLTLGVHVVFVVAFGILGLVRKRG